MFWQISREARYRILAFDDMSWYLCAAFVVGGQREGKKPGGRSFFFQPPPVATAWRFFVQEMGIAELLRIFDNGKAYNIGCLHLLLYAEL